MDLLASDLDSEGRLQFHAHTPQAGVTIAVIGDEHDSVLHDPVRRAEFEGTVFHEAPRG